VLRPSAFAFVLRSLRVRGAMSDKVGSKVVTSEWGLGVGSVMGVLFAPKVREDTREDL